MLQQTNSHFLFACSRRTAIRTHCEKKLSDEKVFHLTKVEFSSRLPSLCSAASSLWIWFGPSPSLPLFSCWFFWWWCCCLFRLGLGVVWMYGTGVVVGFGGKWSSASTQMKFICLRKSFSEFCKWNSSCCLNLHVQLSFSEFHYKTVAHLAV